MRYGYIMSIARVYCYFILCECVYVAALCDTVVYACGVTQLYHVCDLWSL